MTPTKRGLQRLKEDPRFEGWVRSNTMHRKSTEQVVFDSMHGPEVQILLPFVKPKRVVSLSVEYETESLIVWEEVLHPNGAIGHRHDCLSDPDKAISKFDECVDRLAAMDDVGKMDDEVHVIDREYVDSLIASRFLAHARSELRREVEARKREVEREGQKDAEKLAAELMADQGYETK